MLPIEMTQSGLEPHAPTGAVRTRPAVLPGSAGSPPNGTILLVGQLVISFLVSAGCVWIILAPTNQQTTDGAFALLGVIVTAWLTRVPIRDT